MRYRISADTGGTFTDVVVVDATGRQVVGKAPTTFGQPFHGMRAALHMAAGELGRTLEEVLAQCDLLIYGTTIATNAIVEKNTAKTAFLTTAGFPDILVLREGGKVRPHDFSVDYPDPYIPRRHTFEIVERVNAEGKVTIPLDTKQARRVLERLSETGFEAVAVTFLWSIANPANELAMARLLEERLPGVPYTLSHRLAPIIREYRRASATAIDASLKPLVRQHLRDLERDIRDAGYGGEILVSTALGGCMRTAELADRPIFAIGSGPAMAPVAGLDCAAAEGIEGDIIVCDTGGTTFDVSLVRDGRIAVTRETWLDGQWTGHILGISSVDVRSIGAGGGSIAWLDSGGLMRVGPHSAGAEPGPACYGRGGRAPTVTDAALVLGFLDADYFLGGRMRLDAGAAREAVGSLARDLKRSLHETAFGIVNLVNELMIKAIEEITLNEGVDPRDAVLVAGGGAAGLSILPIASELGCTKVILPKTAGTLSASGMQSADIVFEQSAPINTRSDDFDYVSVNAALASLDAELRGFEAGVGSTIADGTSRVEFIAEARYPSQLWELDVPLRGRRFESLRDVALLAADFHDAHRRVYAIAHEREAVECVGLKGRLTIPPRWRPTSLPADCPSSAKHAAPPHRHRMIYFGTERAAETPVFLSSDLYPGFTLQGPAVIQEPTTTLVIYPGASCSVSRFGNFIATSGAPSSHMGRMAS